MYAGREPVYIIDMNKPKPLTEQQIKDMKLISEAARLARQNGTKPQVELDKLLRLKGSK